MNLYRLGVCLKCHGDLAYDYGDWICLQCGVYYYTGLYPETQPGATGGSGLLLLCPAQGGSPAQNGADILNYGDAGEQLAPAAD